MDLLALLLAVIIAQLIAINKSNFMIKKIILTLAIIISMPIVSRASFFDDLLKNIDNTLNNNTFDNTATVIPENKMNNNEHISTNPSNSNNCFVTPLEIGDENDNVKQLQEFLISLPNIYPEKLITGYFGSLTKQAVMRFQLKYKKDILEPIGLLKPTGYVGQSTLNKINKLIGCYITNNQASDIIINNNQAKTSLLISNNKENIKNEPINSNGVSTYELTNSLGCGKDPWKINCKDKNDYICLANFLNTQNINYSNLYVQPKNNISYSCTPQLTLLQADVSYQDKLKSFGFSISNQSIPKTDIADKYICPQDIFINRWIYNQPTCYHMTNSLNSPVHYKENILFKNTSPGYGTTATEEKVNTIDICDIKNNMCTTFQKDKHKLFDNANDCSTYCATQTKSIETIDINVPCLVYPHSPYTNEPVFITSAYNPQKESKFWAPSILFKYSPENWKLASNQKRDDIQVFNFNDYSDKLLWPHNYDFQTTNAPSEQPYGLYGQKFFAFKNPGKYQYDFIDTKQTSNQQINFHYNCTINVDDNPKYKIIFITDKVYPADFKKIGANKICNNHAKNLGYTTEFEILLQLDNIGSGGDVYRLPKIYTDGSVADNTAKTLNLSYNGFFCDGAYWRFFASSYSVAGQAKASQFCAIPHFKWFNGWNNKWLSDLGKNVPNDARNGGYDYSNSFWYSKWFSFPGSEKMLSYANCNNFTSANSKEGANKIFSPVAPMQPTSSNGLSYVLDKGSIPCNHWYPIACIEKTAHTDLERKR